MDVISRLPLPIFWYTISYTSAADHLRLQEVCKEWRDLLRQELAVREQEKHKKFLDYSFSLALPSVSNRCRNSMEGEWGRADAANGDYRRIMKVGKWNFPFCAVTNRRFEECRPIKIDSYDLTQVYRLDNGQSIPVEERSVVGFMEVIEDINNQSKKVYKAFMRCKMEVTLTIENEISIHKKQWNLSQPIRKISHLDYYNLFWFFLEGNEAHLSGSDSAPFSYLKKQQIRPIEKQRTRPIEKRRITAVEVFYINHFVLKRLGVFAEDKKITVMERFEKEHLLYQHQETISCFGAVASDPVVTPYLAAGDIVGNLLFWNFPARRKSFPEEEGDVDLSTTAPKIVEKAHDLGVCLLHSSTINRMVSTDGSTVKWWKASQGTCLATCSQIFQGVTALYNFYEHVLIGTQEGILYLWNVSANSVKTFENSFGSPITALGVDSLRIVHVGCANGEIYRLDFQPEREVEDTVIFL